MIIRQIIQLDGTVDNSSLPTLDVTSEEIAVANIPDIAYWPAVTTWGANDADTGFVDRVADTERLANGYVGVEGRFFTSVDGNLGYSIQAEDMVLREDTDVDTSGSFTIAVIAETELGVGSYNLAGAEWFLSSSSGDLRYEIGLGETGSIDSGGYAAYTGPQLAAGAMHAVVFIVDRENREVRLRVDGQAAGTQSAPSLDTLTILNELTFGRVNAGTPQVRAGHYRSPIAFNRALSGQDMADLEAYLLSEID